VCEGETGRAIEEIRGAPRWEIEDLPLRDALARLVDFQLDRHRQLLGLDLLRAYVLGEPPGRSESPG
jgi:hypothetical protein